MGTGEPLRQSKRVNRGEITPTDQRQVWDRQPRQGVGRARHTEFLAAAFDFRVTSGVSPSTVRPTDRPTDRPTGDSSEAPESSAAAHAEVGGDFRRLA